MSYFEDNMKVIREKHAKIYDALNSISTHTENVFAEDCLSGDKVLIVQCEDSGIALESLYDPAHAAARYCAQFQTFEDPITLLLFGFGDGKVLRNLLLGDYLIAECMVYEPSIDVFYCALQEYDLTDVLKSSKLTIYINGVNDQNMEKIFASRITHVTWKHCYIASLPVYDMLYQQELAECGEWYNNVIVNKKAELSSAIEFAEKGLQNEIRAQRWMIDCWTADTLIGKFPADVPCIVVAAGPSLEKNIDELSRAKGKACIIAVDSAVSFLLAHDIMPDFLCTIDAKKPTKYFDDERLRGIPIFLSTNSNYELFEKIDDFDPIYFSTLSPYYMDIAKKRGHELWGTSGGGSVATMSFWLASQLGFHTIIIIGQDLAYTDMNSHAGTGKVTQAELERYTMYQVPGYYGEDVLTRGDFKIYIEWYNNTIRELKSNHRIINATEGGAKLEGAEQMSLKQAIDQYCNTDVDCKEIYQSQTKFWPTPEDKQSYYQELKKTLDDLRMLQTKAENGNELVGQALNMLGKPSYSERRFEALENQINDILTLLSGSAMYRMLLNRIVENNVNLYESTVKIIDDPEERRKYLYEAIQSHFQDLIKALKECIQLWEESVVAINEEYHFE